MDRSGVQASARGVGVTAEARGLRVFVVEDHDDTRKWLRRFLEMLGHGVVAVRTMEEALAQFPGAGCQVLISDLGLPDGDGWELLERLAPPPGVVAIAMSGFGADADSARSRAVGYRYHLRKPFKISDLTPLLEAARRNEVGG